MDADRPKILGGRVMGAPRWPRKEDKMIRRVFLLFLISSMAPLPAFGEQNIKNCYPVTATDLIRNDAPRFEQYPSKVEKLKKLATVNLRSHPEARTYRTVLRRGAAEGANFAGHYTVIGWGCGTSCTQLAIVNLKTGKVIFPGDFSSTHGVHLAADDFEKEAGSGGFGGLRYRIDSRLLIVVGMLDEDEKREGAYYYLIEKEQLKRIYSINVEKDGWCDDRMKD
jgi:hypothetical protein